VSFDDALVVGSKFKDKINTSDDTGSIPETVFSFFPLSHVDGFRHNFNMKQHENPPDSLK
jgi:hypothetical protein